MFTERLQELREDESAVSPVLGVALLIAITVTLVAVIGVVVLGVGPTNTGAPQANLVFENNSTGAVTMSHQGGDKLDSDNLEVLVENQGNASDLSGEITAGTTTTVATDVNDTTVVKVVWNSPNSDESQVIASFEAN